MQTAKRDVEQLFSFVDEAIEVAPGLARAALEQILAVEPGLERAETLLGEIGDARRQADPLWLVIEAAESLASQGLHLQAREVAAYVRRRFGSKEEARNWLQGVDLLLEA